MSWQVTNFDLKDNQGRRQMQKSSDQDLIEIDSMRVQLIFTNPELVSIKNEDKVKVTVKKEIFKEHLQIVGEDELVFIDSGSFNLVKKLKVPKLLTKEQLNLLEKVSFITEDCLKGFLAANVILAYFSAGAIQVLWGLIHGFQMIAFTSLFDIDIPENVKHVVQTLWELVNLDLLNIEAFLSEVLSFRETEAFKTEYDKDGEPQSRFSDAGFETSNFIELCGATYIVFLASLLSASLASVTNLISRSCKESCLKKACTHKVSFTVICFRFLLESCI